MNADLYRRLLAGESMTARLAPRACWTLTGQDRVRYLNGQVTNDIAHLPDNHACYAAVCTAKGRMEGDLFIAAHGAEFYLDAADELRDNLGLRLEKYLIADDAMLEEVSDRWTVSHIFGSPAPEISPDAFAIVNPRFGLPGHDVWIPGTAAVVIGDTVDAATLDTIRIEHGLPRWGAELTGQTLPPEAGPWMLEAISYTKGCYVGQETIARLKSVGHVNKTLSFLQAETEAFPVTGTKLSRNGREIGTVTSSCFSPRLSRGIALGYVARDAADEGTSLRAGDLPLTVGAALRVETILS